MESRRPSLISNKSARPRKYSTDRVLRQAELSARLEEGRPLVSHTSQIDEHPEEKTEEQLEIRGINSLTRADSLLSPFDHHPGQRLDGYPFPAAVGINSGFDWSATKPWNEPTQAQQEDIERRAAIHARVDTTSLDLTPAQAHIYQRLTTGSESSNAFWRWNSWRTKSQRVKEPSMVSGLHIAAAMHTALGLRFIAQKSPDWLKRQQLHVLEYSASRGKAFSCDANVAFRDTEALRHHLIQVAGGSPRSEDGNAVRLIHIRNNVEAFKYMDEAFAIGSAEIHFGERGFREWMEEDRDSRRTSNMTIRWRPGFDTNRQVTCMALGIDLGSSPITTELSRSKQDAPSRHERFLFQKRRIAIYMQRSPSTAIANPRVTQFNSRGQEFAEFAKQNSIVVCEYSSDAWSEISSTPSLLALSPIAGLRQTGSVAVIASVLGHIFWEIVSKWQSQIAAIHQPFADLEERVYAEPSDITFSNQVWEWSRYLHNMLKLVVRHLKTIQTFQDDFELFAELEEEVEWLDDLLMEMKHVADTIRGDYIEPLEHMIDLMYKSVTIRDSRLSLELGTSLWRLSWITFIFLPLTFLVGFFGMNVDTFQDDPSIKWYFVALIPLVLIVATFWATFNRFGLEYRTGILNT